MQKFIVLAVAGFSLSACVVAIGGDDDDWDGPYSHHGDSRRHVTVELEDGDTHRFSCPKGYESFYEEDASGDISYGCKTRDA